MGSEHKAPERMLDLVNSCIARYSKQRIKNLMVLHAFG
jgi:hypothetical protein